MSFGKHTRLDLSLVHVRPLKDRSRRECDLNVVSDT